ncbi:hypothetical protein GCM10020367_35530 [Streptomyces sannanensis]|uniref:Transposase n=1 Tax=Streptomyces sannanensis TaxID=285536 RepID=A0ABP6SD53_9ACTN
MIETCWTVASVSSWLRERTYSQQIQSFATRQFRTAIRSTPSGKDPSLRRRQSAATDAREQRGLHTTRFNLISRGRPRLQAEMGTKRLYNRGWC